MQCVMSLQEFSPVILYLPFYVLKFDLDISLVSVTALCVASLSLHSGHGQTPRSASEEIPTRLHALFVFR